MDQGFPRFTVSDKAERSVRLGHPWVYDTEILSGEGEDGSLATVLNRKGRWLGTALFNSRSKIRLRLISRNTNDDFSESFLSAVCATPSTTAAPSWGRIFPAAV